MHELTVWIYFECIFGIFIIITDLVCNTFEHTQWRITLHKMDQLYFGQIWYGLEALNIHRYCKGSYSCENSHILLTGFGIHSNSYNHMFIIVWLYIHACIPWYLCWNTCFSFKDILITYMIPLSTYCMFKNIVTHIIENT